MGGQGWHGFGGVESSLLPTSLSCLCLTFLCRAAEAVLQGRSDSILAYHQQNVPRAKLDQVSVAPGPTRSSGLAAASPFPSHALPLSSCRPPKCHPPQSRYP